MPSVKVKGPNVVPADLTVVVSSPSDYPEEQVQAVKEWIHRYTEDLIQKDPLVLAERGITVLDKYNYLDPLDHACWQYANMMRRKLGPIQLEDCVAQMKTVVDGILSVGRTLHQDPTPALFYAVSLERKNPDGAQDSEVMRLLGYMRWDLKHPNPQALGPTNGLLARSTMARALRRARQIRKAEFEEDLAVKHIHENILSLSPDDIRWNTLGFGERPEDSPILEKLGGESWFDKYQGSATYTPRVGWKWTILDPPGAYFVGTSGTPHAIAQCFLPSKWVDPSRLPDMVGAVPPAEVNKDAAGKQECWVSGCRVSEGLKKCSRCDAKYCSQGHQAFAWSFHKKTSCAPVLAKMGK